MKNLKYIVLVCIIFLYVACTLVFVEPFLENPVESYILLLREPNEYMLSSFTDISRSRAAYDLTNANNMTIFMRTHSDVVNDLQGPTAFTNLFTRVSSTPDCGITLGSTTYLVGTTYESHFNTWKSNLNTYALGMTVSPITLTPDLTDISTSIASYGATTAFGDMSLFGSWSCPTGCTIGPVPSIAPNTLSSTLLEGSSDAISAYSNAYINRIGEVGSTYCNGEKYYRTDTGITCSDFQPSTSALTELISNNMSSYLLSSPNPGYTCTTTSTSYIPSYMMVSNGTPVSTSTDPEGNKFYNGILLARAIGDDFKWRVIANEVSRSSIASLK